jgi:hypothetical protein
MGKSFANYIPEQDPWRGTKLMVNNNLLEFQRDLSK